MSSEVLYTVFLILASSVRFIELRISRKHQAELADKGVAKSAEPMFRWMVLLHTAIFVFACAEVWILQRPFIPNLAIVAGTIYILSTLLRWWVIRVMGEHWNVQVMNSTPTLGVITDGPYKWIRHPNYVAVFLELLSVPLIHTAWITAILGSVAHFFVLRNRINLEESILLSDPKYKELMAQKPRFIPRLLRAR